MDYQNKIVLVTGASSTIGKELIRFFASKGCNLIITYYHNKTLVDNLKDEIVNKYDIKVDSLYLDLCKEESIIKLSNFVKEKYGKLDILINNAALSLDSYYEDKTKSEFMRVLETNVVGTFLMIKFFENVMNNGYIFNMSSTDGIDTGNVYSIDYNASKAAINSMTKTISLASENKIISICPNWVDTDSTKEIDNDYLNNELKRIGQKKLISPTTIAQVIDDCIKKKIETGTIIRIEGDEDVRRIS